jgi:hypothetical protein
MINCSTELIEFREMKSNCFGEVGTVNLEVYDTDGPKF